jgi:hypothetical protein
LRKNVLCTTLIVPVFIATLTGCGSSNKPDTGAIHQFITQENASINTVNKDFTAESSLIKAVSTKQISYTNFKSSYEKEQLATQKEINVLAAAKATKGAETYQKEYVSLLNEGLHVFADQEASVRPDRTVDKTKSQQVSQELKTFVQNFQGLAAKYGMK